MALNKQEIREKLKQDIPLVKQKDISSFMKNQDIKNNTKYSAYNFRTKEHEEKCKIEPSAMKGVTSIYNDDCLRFLIQELSKIG